MAHASTGRLRDELGRVEEELGSARLQEYRTGERHDREGTAETEAVLGSRRTRTERLEEERGGLVAELGRRAVAGAGWSPDDAGGSGHAGGPAPPPACGMAGTLRIGPHPLLPERGWLIHDRSAGTVAWVREVPSPAGASEILAEHGVEWEAELLSHSLEPVPEEAERGPKGPP